MATESDRKIAEAIVRLYYPEAATEFNSEPSPSELENVKRVALRNYDRLPPELKVLMHLKGWIP